MHEAERGWPGLSHQLHVYSRKLNETYPSELRVDEQEMIELIIVLMRMRLMLQLCLLASEHLDYA